LIGDSPACFRDQLSQDFHYGFLPPSILHPSASVGAVSFIIFILSDSGAAREGASLASSGYEKARSA
jgi:hypothetical protein